MNTHAIGEPSQSGIYPRFYMGSKQSKTKTDEAGYPCFIDQEMVEIRIAGDPRTVVVRKVLDEHKQRWPQHYEAFKKGQAMPQEGLPLKHCPLFTEAQVRTMNGQNIFTVEALAELPDSFIDRLGMGGRGLVAKAKAYLKNAEGSKEVTKLASENERMKQEIELLKEQMKSMLSSQPAETVASVAPVATEAKGPEWKKPVDAVDALTGPLSALGDRLSQRTVTALRKAKVHTVEELKAVTPEQLSNMPGIGLSAIDEITGLFE